MHFVYKAFVAGIFLLAAQGCTTGLILATTAAAGSGAVGVFNDRRHEDAQHADDNIKSQIESLLAGDDTIKGSSHVRVDSYNKVVLITGEAVSESVRERILSMAAQVQGIRKIHNEVAIMPPLSNDAKETDTLINAKVKATLIASEGIDATLTLAVTSKQTVYLMGLMTRAEAERINKVVRSVEGIRQVVPLFEYVRLVAEVQ